MVDNNIQNDVIIFLRTVKYFAIAFGALMVAGITTLMFIAWDTDEDITGIVAPALLVTFIATFVAVFAAILQKRMIGRNAKTEEKV